ncbi:MAG TPA: carbamoyltransferase HypF [Acidimicrobiales bacterium]|nr:carbamoyltransferase HypF [Acidimicrobiales bacterium]
MPGALTTRRRRVRVRGTVQGVGFRPFVYRHAVALRLAGFVRNDTEGVLIEAQGPEAALAELCRVLRESPPPLARVETVEATTIPTQAAPGGFRIIGSTGAGVPAVPVSVDTATCDACLAEVDDPADRRYGYPFTSCTDCGPRYTIVTAVPYDRPATTMAGFTMCERCRAEYEDPADRRFHAQPNACPACGPTLRLVDPTGAWRAEGPGALDMAVEALTSGLVLALKGIGGYHLAADATDPVAVAELRRRKARDDKPFAVMAASVEHARRLCHLTPAAAALLASARRPIVLAPRRADATVADGVAPGLAELGIFLPYSSLHHLLLARAGRPLVMTSGNLSDDPIAHVDGDALARLGPLVDAVVLHDRPIHIRCDDSVVRSTGDRLQVLRRSRGYAPEPMRLPGRARRQVLAVGAELKNTVSVATGTMLVPSHHIGDLEHLGAYRAFLQAAEHLCHLTGVEPDVVAHDLHPEYLSTKYALDSGRDTLAVQHHHAHVASCLVEHGHTGTVLGVAFDGLGLGSDGSLWGGEFLVADLRAFERVGHLAPVGLPGGIAAIREPWRMAVAWARAALGAERAQAVGAALDGRTDQVLAVLEHGDPPETTSAGRLFDAVAAVLGIRLRVTYEGQAAVELEALAAPVAPGDAPLYPVGLATSGGVLVLDPAPLVAAVIEEVARGTPAATVAAGFHRGLGAGVAAAAADLAGARGIDTVALSGGVFQNVRLTAAVEDALAARGVRVLLHRDVPPNDGGISVGQAAIAALAGS